MYFGGGLIVGNPTDTRESVEAVLNSHGPVDISKLFFRNFAAAMNPSNRMQ